jgi:hypothetical protein
MSNFFSYLAGKRNEIQNLFEIIQDKFQSGIFVQCGESGNTQAYAEQMVPLVENLLEHRIEVFSVIYQMQQVQVLLKGWWRFISLYFLLL